MFHYPIIASFGYAVIEIVRFHTDFALKWNYASANTRIRLDIIEAAYNLIGAAYKGFMSSVLK